MFQPPNRRFTSLLKSIDDRIAEMKKLDKLMFVSPHCDDESISAGALLAELSSRGVAVNVVLLFSGFRCPSRKPLGLTPEEMTRLRVAEGEAAADRLGVIFHPLLLDAYTRDYCASPRDRARVAGLFTEVDADLVLVPPWFDTHAAHAEARRIAAKGLADAGLTPVIASYETPWGVLAGSEIFNTFFEFSRAQEEAKTRALGLYGSQLEGPAGTDYIRTSVARNRAHAELLRQMVHGHEKIVPHRGDIGGAEVFRFEGLDHRTPANGDPIQMLWT